MLHPVHEQIEQFPDIYTASQSFLPEIKSSQEGVVFEFFTVEKVEIVGKGRRKPWSKILYIKSGNNKTYRFELSPVQSMFIEKKGIKIETWKDKKITMVFYCDPTDRYVIPELDTTYL